MEVCFLIKEVSDGASLQLEPSKVASFLLGDVCSTNFNMGFQATLRIGLKLAAGEEAWTRGGFLGQTWENHTSLPASFIWLELSDLASALQQ